MKLFITNKDVFDNDFPSQQSQKFVHKTAYNILMQSLGSKNGIPQQIRFDYDLWFIEFNFTNCVNHVYFYTYERW
jgi:hypothetical protein